MKNKLNDILDLLIEIEKTTGTGCKKIIENMLKENWSDELEYVLNVALNQFILTHLNKLSETDNYGIVIDDTFNQFKELMEECISVKACTKDLRERVTLFVNSFEGEQKRILTMIVTKNLNISMGRKLINKAMKRVVIPTPSAMLADKGVEKIDKWDTKYLRINTKYDGVRVLATFSYKDGWRLFTRNFNEFDKTKMTNVIGNLNEAFRNHVDNVMKYQVEGFFVDGELIMKDSIEEGKNSSGARQNITGEVNRILKGKAPEGIDKQFDFVVFDLDKLSVLEVGKGIEKYSSRREHIERILEDKVFSNVSLAKEWIVENTENGRIKIREIYDELIAKGEEGTIIKHPDSVYECKRGKFWIKMKEVLSADLKCIEVIEGSGKMVGTLGAIVCEFSTGETVKVGSGFNDKERAEIWEKPESIIGKIAEIEYNCISTDKKGKYSLFLPIYKGIRVDKDLADNLPL